RLAVEGEPWLEISDLELRRSGPSYTVDTLRDLRAGLAPGDELFFIAGADVLRDLDRWYKVDELLGLATFVAATRPGHALEVPPRFRDRVRALEIEAIPVSATEVRERLGRADPAAEALLPP